MLQNELLKEMLAQRWLGMPVCLDCGPADSWRFVGWMTIFLMSFTSTPLRKLRNLNFLRCHRDPSVCVVGTQGMKSQENLVQVLPHGLLGFTPLILRWLLYIWKSGPPPDCSVI